MSSLPKPITYEGKRILNEFEYKQRVLEDDLMKDVKTLIAHGKTVFDNLDKVIDLTDIDSIQMEPTSMVLPPGFVR